MPGQSIGTELNRAEEIVWRGRVTITRNAKSEHMVNYEYSDGPEQIDELVKFEFRRIIQILDAATRKRGS